MPPAPKEPEKFDPSKPLKNARGGADDSKPELGNPYFPRYGSVDAHNFFVWLGIEDFLARQTGKNALKLAKAWSHFMQAALGVGRVPRPRVDVVPEAGDAPDVAERSPASAAGNVDRGSFSYGNPFSDHYATVANQMAQGARSVHNS